MDWSKKTVNIRALLPQVGLPDVPAAGADSKPRSIELGTPLEIETHATLHLPPGTVARAPTGMAVVRDYAKFASKYEANGSTISAQRHVSFLQREVSAERAADYSAFVRAVQNDEAQEFTLERSDASNAREILPTGREHDGVTTLALQKEKAQRPSAAPVRSQN